MSDRVGREPLLRRLGVAPPVGDLIREAIDEAIERAEADRDRAGRPRPAVSALDAGCGRHSALARYRSRIATLVGVDVHEPAPGAMPYLDAFVASDVCVEPDAFAPASFDLILSSFTAEHLADPAAALRNFATWLRPGGTLVLTTVNRRHPFVAAYLGLPDPARRRLQPLVKASAADAHPLVGTCNDPGTIRSTLAAAGFLDARTTTVGHLARAWSRWPATFALGLVGDLLTRDLPSRRSTIVVTARTPTGDAATGTPPS